VYSNQGYAIAGRMIELAAGASWESLVRTRIAEPLGMTTVGFGPPSRATGGAAPVGHDESGAVKDIDNPQAIAPAGTMHCSMEDWARFIAVHLGQPSAIERLGLDGGSIAAMHAAQGADGTYGLGWQVAERPWGGRVVTHAGSNTVWFCVAWVAPERGFALLAATNQGGTAAAKACDDAVAALVGLMSPKPTPQP
jgi:CubicO group peptidase (beta-lactamase class C family)